ncbi:unnamed protein product [Parascedosporium putredinis]|uniref:Cellobiose dehydrogenase-like cytochrome domain-containing protein n=1 Tax=Parascedosporium putredinis TaxID=1442378 RepID=A0A9P1MDF8_9PEZI|nr:unnamed protein product [Parascedosporium putredinis]CAI8002483.1 unnamed protein product [Parascedosporium putredinis]
MYKDEPDIAWAPHDSLCGVDTKARAKRMHETRIPERRDPLPSDASHAHEDRDRSLGGRNKANGPRLSDTVMMNYAGVRGLAAMSLALLLSLATGAVAQYPDMIPGSYTDAETGIDFQTWTAPPADNGDGASHLALSFQRTPPQAMLQNTLATWYVFSPLPTPKGYGKRDAHLGITLIVSQSCASIASDRSGWCGLAHDGHMISSLLLVAYPHDGKVLTSFRWATDYFMPDLYAGDGPPPAITQLRSSVNESRYEIVYRCENCFAWSAPGGAPAGGSGSSTGAMGFGYAQAADPRRTRLPVQNVTREDYSTWAALEGDVVVGECEAPKPTCKSAAKRGQVRKR